MLECKICGFKGLSLITHIPKHEMTTREYREIYGKDLTLRFTSIEIEERKSLKGQYKCRWWRLPEYWIERFGISYEDAVFVISEKQKYYANLRGEFLPEHSIWSVEHWLKKGLTTDEAVKKVYEIQSTNSNKSSRFRGKKHTDEIKLQISNTMINLIQNMGVDNWTQHLRIGKTRSNLEIICYEYLKDNVCSELQGNVPIRGKVVDMIYKNKIIEFNGDYWHGNPELFSADQVLSFPGHNMMVEDIWKRDLKRTLYLENLGYEVFVLWQYDWKNRFDETLERIKKYLYGP